MAGNFVFSKGEKSPGMVWYFERKVFRARKNGAVFGLLGFFFQYFGCTPPRFCTRVLVLVKKAIIDFFFLHSVPVCECECLCYFSWRNNQAKTWKFSAKNR